MTRLVDRLLRRTDVPAYSELDYTGAQYIASGDLGGRGKETTPAGFVRQVRQTYRQAGPVFACIDAQMWLAAEVLFKYQSMIDGKLTGNTDLKILEHPWPTGTTGDLVSRMIQDAATAGQSYIRRADPEDGGDSQLVRMRPEAVTIVSEEVRDSGGRTFRRKVGYIEDLAGLGAPEDPQFFSTDEVAHFAPIPDPDAMWRGMSWLTAIMKEVSADTALTEYRFSHLKRGAMPGLVLKYSRRLSEPMVERMKRRIAALYEGPENAGGTLVLDEGADAAALGSTLQQLQVDVVAAVGERRLCSAAGVPLEIVGLKDGPYETAIRRMADLWARPHWRMMCGCLEHLIPTANDSAGLRLWYDVSGIAALREGELARGQTTLVKAQAVASFVLAGFTRESAIAAAESGDIGQLVPSPQAPAPGVAGRETSTEKFGPDGKPLPVAQPGAPGGPGGGPANNRAPQAALPQNLPGVGHPNLPNALPGSKAAPPQLANGARGKVGRAVVPPFGWTEETTRAEWTEGLHPRDRRGEFAHSPGAGGGVAGPPSAPAGALHTRMMTMAGASPALRAKLDARLTSDQIYTRDTPAHRKGDLRRPAVPPYQQSVAKTSQAILDGIAQQGTLEQGKAWYPEENRRARNRASAYGCTVEEAAGVESATSPRCSYAINQRVTDEILDSVPRLRGHDGQAVLARAGGGVMGGFRDDGVTIACGGDIAGTLTGPKRQSFFNNIMWPGKTDDVTVDTWMFDSLSDGLGLVAGAGEAAGRGADHAVPGRYRDDADRRRDPAGRRETRGQSGRGAGRVLDSGAETARAEEPDQS